MVQRQFLTASPAPDTAGFTLIELSVVLVIIGLIVGGILFGQDLIKAAEVRSQITQIEKYNSAVNTFRVKFGALPGDLPLVSANQFGFTTDAGCNGTSPGARNGDGLIQGYNSSGTNNNFAQATGETGYFWQDLTSPAAGRLIEGSFPHNSGMVITCGILPDLNTTPGTTFIGDYMPQGKIGYGTYVYVYPWGGYNWYCLAMLTAVLSMQPQVNINGSIPVVQAYNIDKKLDDGLPYTGVVQTVVANGTTEFGGGPSLAPGGCVDAILLSTWVYQYSLSSADNYGNQSTCYLSFRFQ